MDVNRDESQELRLDLSDSTTAETIINTQQTILSCNDKYLYAILNSAVGKTPANYNKARRDKLICNGMAIRALKNLLMVP